MKLFATVLALMALLFVACGGDDEGNGDGANAIVPATDADRVAHAALPTLDDLPGSGWVIIAEDQFDTGSSEEFLQSIQGNPDCATLEDLATLQAVFGGAEEDEQPVGRAQVEIEQQTAESLIPTSVEVEVEIEESASGSQAQFGLVRELFESDDTANCLISALNKQFAESGQSGLQVEIKKGSNSADAPQDGARMAFDVDMRIAGTDFELAMQLYFWPYGNANVQALFLGTRDTLDEDLVGGVLEAVDEKLQVAAGGS